MSINLWLWSFHPSPDNWHILSPFQFVGSLSYVKVRRKGAWEAVGQTGRRETAPNFPVVSELSLSSQPWPWQLRGAVRLVVMEQV